MLLNRIHIPQRVLAMPLMPFSQMKYGFCVCLSSSWSHKSTRDFRCFTDSSTKISASGIENTASISLSNTSPLSGIEDEVAGYVFGKRKATEVAHLVWRHIVQKGDTVIDATCGNGYDTLTLLKMITDGSGRGCVYGFDIQQEALQNTSSLLHEVFPEKEKGCVKLFSICHSRIEEIIPENTPVRLVAFNLGYLPGGGKAITTTPETTLLALEAAKRMLITGGLISVIVYVGHPGGR
ncbi:putative S-adenosylmethionine-dependent methyltransferase [Tripterygium wilfordii]|uniref:Putative S-adenosylmethionine-dependent methyltransferase n=2 Tax=Tripterygium wilfordii TaxID=458696 RepID=A0A7J7C293_TRIWF|nr:putative S-adenosylmethionine-dependent methyltransferase [Tripterygium wilfordii]